MKDEENNHNLGEAEQLTVERAIANLQQKEDLGARYYAAWWLGKFRVTEPEAIASLLMALEDEQDRAPEQVRHERDEECEQGRPERREAAPAL